MKKIRSLLISFIGLFFLMLFNGVKVYANEYYIFDVKSSGVSLNINNQIYTSGEDNLIKVEKNKTGTYIVSSDVLKEVSYTFTSEEVIEILVPKDVVISDDSVFEKDYGEEWVIFATVNFYGGNTEKISLSIELDEMDENELVFENVSLYSDKYYVSQSITLKRITNNISDYKDSFETLKNSSDNFKEKAFEVKNKFSALKKIYSENNVSELTKQYYNDYLLRNDISEESLNYWLSNIVDKVELYDEDFFITYGDDVVTNVLITYLNGSEVVSMGFDYKLEDIDNNVVHITSIEKLILIKNGKYMYNDFLSYDVKITKRKIYSQVESYDTVYNGNRQDILVSVGNVSEKFQDTITNQKVSYSINDKSVEPINVGIYKVSLSFNLTNNKFYDYSEFIFNDYIIHPSNIDNLEFSDKNFIYTGESVNFQIQNNILPDGKEASINYMINDRYIDSLVNAGTYNVTAIISNSNYNTLELSARIIIEKADTSIDFNSKTFTDEFSENGFNYRRINNIFEDGNIASIEYDVFSEIGIKTEIYNVGKYKIVAKITDPRNNYNEKIVEAMIIITPKAINVEYIGENFTYNGSPQSPEIIAKCDISVKYNTIDEEKPINVGEYTMKITSANANYVISNDTYYFIITPVTILLENFTDRDIEYCNCSAVNDVTISNIYTNDDVHLVFEYILDDQKVDDVVNVGENYIVRIVGLEGINASNYSIDGISRKINVKIMPKNIYITPKNVTKLYSENDPVLPYDVSPSIYDQNDIVGILAREEGEDVGRYKISIGSLKASKNYNVIFNRTGYLDIMPKPLEIKHLYEKLVYDGKEKNVQINIVGEGHAEHEKIVNAGSYTIRIVVDSNNYCLPNDYKDIVITVEKRDATSNIQLKNSNFVYTGNNPYIEIMNDYDFDVEYYNMNNELLKNAIMPGEYKVKVMINDINEFSNSVFDIVVDKKKYVLDDVTIIPHYNKIVVNHSNNLEYKINNGDYFDNNEFNWLNELSEYTISVRIKEDDVGYASEPIVRVIKTTRNPSSVNQLIDILSENVNEYNLLTLKSIYNYMKDTNSSDVDSDKYAKYLSIKEKYDNILNNYSEDVEKSSNLIGFMNKSIYSVTISLLSLLFFVVIKKKIEL